MSKILGEMDQQLWDFKKGESNQEQSFKAVLFGNAERYEPVKIIASYLFDLFIRGETQALNPNIRAAVFRIILSDEKLSIDDDNVSSLPICNLLSLFSFSFPFL